MNITTTMALSALLALSSTITATLDAKSEGAQSFLLEKKVSKKSSMPVLISSLRFTGMTQIKKDNSYRGGYYYADLTEDSLTQIINTAFRSHRGDSMLVSYIKRCAEQVCNVDEVDELSFKKNDALSAKFTYPVYTAEWMYGSNEDTRCCYAFFMETDTYTYMYVYDIHGDSAEDMMDLWKEALNSLKLI